VCVKYIIIRKKYK